MCHLATGDMLRSAVAAKSPMGMEAKKAMDAGALVSDEIVVGLIEEAMQSPQCRTGRPLLSGTVPSLSCLVRSSDNSLVCVVRVIPSPVGAASSLTCLSYSQQ